MQTIPAVVVAVLVQLVAVPVDLLLDQVGLDCNGQRVREHFMPAAAVGPSRVAALVVLAVAG
jgi:hypothetical protein